MQVLFMGIFYYQFSDWMVSTNEYLMITVSEDITYFDATSDTAQLLVINVEFKSIIFRPLSVSLLCNILLDSSL